MGLERFAEFIGPPELNSDISSDWLEFEGERGFSLPRDYKEFVSAYGPCEIYGDLYVSHPRGSVLNLGGFVDRVSREFNSIRLDFPEKYPYSIFPEPGGLFPIAETMAGTQINILPAGEGPDDWVTVVNWQGWWSEYSFGFTEFLLGALSGDSGIPLFEDGFRDGSVLPYVLHEVL
ncbi:SMI1/KNR4 family protein [Streptomyces sp. NBC_01216]|uniref:SMI1/KNR4 family protein n=1 Tax=Streptomyces sp. NBC_01216 TaxID=2903778 RepID=UPI002E12CE50|nr:SMI1/KNR4 family protein [Streptomyces sp. NBC_01216]